MNKEAWDEGYEVGYQDGKKDAKKQLLSLLQTKFMTSEISVNDPSMKAILEVAKTVSEEYKIV